MTEERKQIGWTMVVENVAEDYRIVNYKPLYAPPKGSLVTQAFILCRECGGAISGTNGPKYNAVCFKCFNKLHVNI